MLVSMPHGKIVYSATSLEDIAQGFEFNGRCAISNCRNRTKRDTLLSERERDTWQRAADILRNTTITE